MQPIKGYLRLMRPANIVTAVSDILAGIAIAGYFGGSTLQLAPVVLLALATAGLYGGGVVFNDVCDAELDRIERPERPIPSGLVSKGGAATLGTVLLLAGITAAWAVHRSFLPSTALAIAIAAAALVYDKWGKHHPFLGPLNMGLCRGLNIALGISILPAALGAYWFLGIIPVVYIAAITMISRGEVHGGSKAILKTAALFYVVVIGSILWVAFRNGNAALALLFLVLFGTMIFLPLQKAVRNPVGPSIGKAVKSGVLALILMNAAWAAAFGIPSVALVILVLLPLSLYLARAFAVT